MTDHRSPKTHRDPPTSPPPWQDWDSYEVEPEPLDDRVPAHPSLPARRPGCVSVLPWLALALLLVGSSIATPSGAPVIPPGGTSETRMLTSATPTGTGRTLRSVPHGAEAPSLPLAAPAVPEIIGSVAASPTGGNSTAIQAGWISWAEPFHGGDYLAVRLPRGTLVRLCAVRCLVRVTTDWGPRADIDPPRLADIAVLDWELLCDRPRDVGLCRGTLEAIPAATLPPTSMEPPDD